MMEGTLDAIFANLEIETLDKPLVIEYVAYLNRIEPTALQGRARAKHAALKARLLRRLMALKSRKE